MEVGMFNNLLDLIANSRLSAAITLAVAVWGAITGTVALFLEARKLRRDRAIVVPHPEFHITYNDTSPPSVDLFVGVVNDGHRPAFLSEIWARLAAPSPWWEAAWRFRKLGWLRLRDYRIEIEPGQREDVHLPLPRNVRPYDVRLIEVIDQSGKRWRARTRQRAKARKVLEATVIHEEEFTGTVRGRAVFLQHLASGHEEAVLIRIDIPGSRAGGPRTRQLRAPRFGAPHDARSLLNRARPLAGRYVNGEIDNLLAELDNSTGR
jgi:hypothetical protein